MSYPFWYQSRFGVTRRLNVPTPAPLSGYIAEGPSQGSFNQKIPWAVPEEIAAERGPLDGYFGSDIPGLDTLKSLYQTGSQHVEQGKQVVQDVQTGIDTVEDITGHDTGVQLPGTGGEAAGAGGTYMAQQFVKDPVMQQQLCAAMSPPATDADCAIWGLPWGDGAGSPVDIGGGGSVQISLHRLPTTQQAMLRADPAMAMQMQTKAQAAAACANNGGVMLPYSDGKTYCQPSPATKAACAQTGNTPTWDPYNKYKCGSIVPPPIVVGNPAAAAAAAAAAAPGTAAPAAAAGGLGKSLPIIAGVAAVALLLMRR